MVIFIVEVDYLDFGLVDPERDPPVLGHEKAPGAFSIASELMGLSAPRVNETACVRLSETPDKYLQEDEPPAMIPDNPVLTAGKSLAPRNGVGRLGK